MLPYYYYSNQTTHRGFAVDRCIHNAMVDSDPCKATPIHQLKSAHFTNCLKPWGCVKRHKQPLCNQLHQKWLELLAGADRMFDLPRESGIVCEKEGPQNYKAMKLLLS